MNVKEAARQLELKLGTVYALCRSGDLTHMRVGQAGKTIRLEQSDIDEYKRRARERALPTTEEDDEPVLKYITTATKILENPRHRPPSSPAGRGGRAVP